MSKNTDSAEIATTVPSIWPPDSRLREWLRSYWESSPSNDSFVSGLNWDSGMLELDITNSLLPVIKASTANTRGSYEDGLTEFEPVHISRFKQRPPPLPWF